MIKLQEDKPRRETETVWIVRRITAERKYSKSYQIQKRLL